MKYSSLIPNRKVWSRIAALLPFVMHKALIYDHGMLGKIPMKCYAIGMYKQLEFGKAQKCLPLSLKTLTPSFQWDLEKRIQGVSFQPPPA